MNLTSIKTVRGIVQRHYCESLFLASVLPDGASTVGDIGSGPGFPGVPIAVLHRDYTVALVEANAKKCVFLREATRHIPNISVIELRSEELEQKFDWIVSRAVRWPDVRDTVRKSGRGVALLIGARDLDSVVHEDSQISWRAPIQIPWGERRYLAIGRYVSRETTSVGTV
jgi:16S rRNA (guanine527-N7)-methyltransferase